MTRGAAFIEACQSAGVNAFFGVPCSYLADAFAVLDAPDVRNYQPATREDLALGAAAGAALCGRMPAVLMQNSGLGVGLNALQSLLQMYGLPCLLVVSWRGEPAAGFSDAPEHAALGAQMPELLRICDMPVFFLDNDNTTTVVRTAVAHSKKTQQPVALVVRRGLLDKGGGTPSAPGATFRPDAATSIDTLGKGTGAEASGQSCVDVCMKAITRRHPDALVVACNGFISREVFAACDRPQNFYMLGSMGLAASIGLGAAWASPKRPVVVVEGDGNALMGLATLPMVGQAKLRNLWHIVLNNGMHRSTGSQRTAGATVNFAAVAKSCGYARAAQTFDGPALFDEVTRVLDAPGPAYVAIHGPAERSPASRVRLTPAEIALRVRTHAGA